MKAEIAKVRYLPLPRWTALAVLGSAVVMGAAMVISTPDKVDSYFTIPDSVLEPIFIVAGIVLGVWISTLEFSAGTMQRTLTAETSRSRVLASKLIVILVAAIGIGLGASATAGGLLHLAAAESGIPLDSGDLARLLFGLVLATLPNVVVGFGFGLLARSIGGGITLALGFVFVVSGFLSFLPGFKNLNYSLFTTDLTNAVIGQPTVQHGFWVALLGTAAWMLVIVIPGWVSFVRGDLK